MNVCNAKIWSVLWALCIPAQVWALMDFALTNLDNGIRTEATSTFKFREVSIAAQNCSLLEVVNGCVSGSPTRSKETWLVEESADEGVRTHITFTDRPPPHTYGSLHMSAAVGINPDRRGFTEYTQLTINWLLKVIATKKRELENELNDHSPADEVRSEIEATISALDEIVSEIDVLKNSETVYKISINEKYNSEDQFLSGITLNKNDLSVEITLSSLTPFMLVHELKHAYQFEQGHISFHGIGGHPFYDINDEKEAYARGEIFGGPSFESQKERYSQLYRGTVGYYGPPNPDSTLIQNYLSQGGYFKIHGKIYVPQTNTGVRSYTETSGK